MSSTTPNLGLTKPATTDVVDITVLNGNFDILDNAAMNPTYTSGDGTGSVDPGDVYFHPAITVPAHSVVMISGGACFNQGTSGGFASGGATIVVRITQNNTDADVRTSHDHCSMVRVISNEATATAEPLLSVETSRVVRNNTNTAQTWYLNVRMLLGSGTQAERHWWWEATTIGYA